MSWDDARVEALKKMWESGMSASEIAKELGNVTRNAVIGKVHRLGLKSRVSGGKAAEKEAKPTPKPATSNAASEKKPAPKKKAPSPQVETKAPETELKAREDKPAPKRPMPLSRPVIIDASKPLPPQPSTDEISEETLEKVAEVEKNTKRLTLLQLTERTCKWPIGDPATDDFWFCGHPSQAGKPYCEAHVELAFQAVLPRRR